MKKSTSTDPKPAPVISVEMNQNSHGVWYWLLRSANGECLCHSESYSSKAKCAQTAKMVAGATLTIGGVSAR